MTKKNDLTRIEDLSELLHSEDEEDFQSLDNTSAFEEKTEPNHSLDDDDLFANDDINDDTNDLGNLSQEKTDPDMNLEDMTESPEENNEFSGDFNNDFNSDFNTDFNSDFNSELTNQDSTEIADTFGDSNSTDFTNDSSEFSDDFTSDSQNDNNEFNTEDDVPPESPQHQDILAPQSPNKDEVESISLTNKKISTPSPFELSSAPLKTEKIQKAEDLSEVKKFAQNISYGDASAEGTPPFSLIIRNVRFVEDADGIIDALKEHGIAKEDTLAKMRKSLELGSILISRISEYSAIFLAHKLRKYNVDIMMGLADEIHPPKSYKSDDKGLVNKRNIYQNKTESHKFVSGDLNAEDIMLTTANSFDNFYIDRYIGIISESTQFEVDEIHQHTNNDKNKNNLQVEIENIISQFSSTDGKKDWDTKISDIYYQMANKLKPQALKLKGNAVVGITYQLLSIPTLTSDQKQVYRLICSGNVVWLQAEK